MYEHIQRKKPNIKCHYKSCEPQGLGEDCSTIEFLEVPKMYPVLANNDQRRKWTLL